MRKVHLVWLCLALLFGLSLPAASQAAEGDDCSKAAGIIGRNGGCVVIGENISTDGALTAITPTFAYPVRGMAIRHTGENCGTGTVVWAGTLGTTGASLTITSSAAQTADPVRIIDNSTNALSWWTWTTIQGTSASMGTCTGDGADFWLVWYY